jgi:hypothetical protein
MRNAKIDFSLCDRDCLSFLHRLYPYGREVCLIEIVRDLTVEVTVAPKLFIRNTYPLGARNLTSLLDMARYNETGSNCEGGVN